jgi:hypothetical protein
MDSWARSGDRLNGGVGLAVAGLAQGDEVRQFVRGPEVVEEPEGPNVMHVDALRAAMLADAAVASLRFPALGEPVRASMVTGAALELGMKRADPVPVPTFAGAELARASGLSAGRAGEPRSATLAIETGRRDLSRRHRRILTGGRA